MRSVNVHQNLCQIWKPCSTKCKAVEKNYDCQIYLQIQSMNFFCIQCQCWHCNVFLFYDVIWLLFEH